MTSSRLHARIEVPVERICAASPREWEAVTDAIHECDVTVETGGRDDVLRDVLTIRINGEGTRDAVRSLMAFIHPEVRT